MTERFKHIPLFSQTLEIVLFPFDCSKQLVLPDGKLTGDFS